MRTTRTGRSRVLLVLVAMALLALTAGTAGAAHARSNRAGDVNPDGSWTDTKTMTRVFQKADGTQDTVDTRTMSLRVDQTKQIQSRERVHLSWTGAHPSGARAASPFGEKGLAQEYPVVIMQCRGTGDQVTPQTCWTSTQLQRSRTVDPVDAVWTKDLYAEPGDRQQESGDSPFPDQCKATAGQYVRTTPFVAASGKKFAGCSADTMPPEAAVGATFPPAEQEAFTGVDGSGQADFEVRSSIENESMGCSAEVACSIVVVPIMGLSCQAPTSDTDYAAQRCRQQASDEFPPGSSNFAGQGVHDSVGPLYWWSASNWRNRFVVPLTMALPPNVCEVLDQRPPVAFYGSELLSQAALQWAPAYCLNKARFKWQQNNMPDDAAFSLMTGGQAAAAEVSGQRDATSIPVGYAPTAVTGFAITYVVDKPDNRGEVTNLRLNARLLAKLLTESYPASARGQGHPGLEGNPVSINTDPEFRQLNPDALQTPMESAATLMSLSTGSDVINALTDYIAHDPDAMAFIKGQPDPWGMKVNPAYRGIKVPTKQWDQKDTYVPPSGQECYQQNPAPYLPQVAAPVNNLRTIATAMLDSWPLVATRCDRATPADPYKLGRIDREGMGSRAMLGLTTLGDARRYGLNTAALQTSAGRFVAPDQAGMASAVALAAPSKKPLQAFTLDQAAIRKKGSAYPGTMVVYTAAATSGADKTTAGRVAQFIRTSTTEGQVAGRGNGQLPEGYLPIANAGVTKPLWRQAQAVAAAVAAQKAVAGKGGGGGSGSAGAPGVGGPQVTALGSPVGASAAGAPGSVSPATSMAKNTHPVAAKVAGVKTRGLTSLLGNILLPLLLAVGIVGLVARFVARQRLRSQGIR